MQSLSTISFSLMTALLLSACGGGGGSSTPITPAPDGGASSSSSSSSGGPSAEGLWNGSATYLGNRSATALVLSDGTYYFLYSKAGVSNEVGGVIFGTGSLSATGLSSSNARDFNLEGQPVRAGGTLNSQAVANTNFDGNFTFNVGNSISFDTSYDADYDTAPTMTAVAGTYTGDVITAAGREPATATVIAATSTSGSFSGVGQSGCGFTGTISPRSSGNVYDVAITFNGGICYFGTQTLSGHGYLEGTTVRVIALNAARDDGVLFVGTKP